MNGTVINEVNRGSQWQWGGGYNFNQPVVWGLFIPISHRGKLQDAGAISIHPQRATAVAVGFIRGSDHSKAIVVIKDLSGRSGIDDRQDECVDWKQRRMMGVGSSSERPVVPSSPLVWLPF